MGKTDIFFYHFHTINVYFLYKIFQFHIYIPGKFPSVELAKTFSYHVIVIFSNVLRNYIHYFIIK